jgi:hypothetical protein
MKRLGIVFLLASGISAQSLPISQGAFVLSNAADAASSWGGNELNPILGNGTFGKKQAIIKGSVTGALLVAESVWVRKHPKDRKAVVVFNWVTASVFTGMAVRNWVKY